MQDELERAVHSLSLQWPVVQEVQTLMGLAENAVDAARGKLSTGGLAAATAAVQSAIMKVTEVEAAARAANLWEDAVQSANTLDPSAGALSMGGAMPEQTGLEGPEKSSTTETPKSYLESANEYMGRTTTAFEAMTANMHFLTQGLMNVNRVMQHQARVMALQTNLLSGSGDHEAQLQELALLQQAGALITESTAMSVKPPVSIPVPIAPGARAQLQEHARQTQKRLVPLGASSPSRFNPSSTDSGGFDDSSELTDDAVPNPLDADDAHAAGTRSSGAPSAEQTGMEGGQDAGGSSLGYPHFPTGCRSLLSRFLTRPVFNMLKSLQTSSGVTLQDCIISGVEHLDNAVGVFACDSESFVLFGALFEPIIMELHPLYSPDASHPVDQDASKLQITAADLDAWLSTTVCISRNLMGYNFLPKASLEQTLQVEAILKDALSSLQGDVSGAYYSLDQIEASPPLKYDLLQRGLLFPPMDRFAYYAFSSLSNFSANPHILRAVQRTLQASTSTGHGGEASLLHTTSLCRFGSMQRIICA
jgi:hypothetical protein